MNVTARLAPLYLDYNATAPLRPSARAAVMAALDRFGNPSSVHRFGRDTRALVEDAREAVGDAIGATPGQVVFTSGATEANALALRGLSQGVLASAIEHPSVLAHVDADKALRVNDLGVIDLAALEAALSRAGGRTVVAVMAANNETGVVQPIQEIAAIAHRYGALVHCDAVQALGKRPVNIIDLGVDSLALSGHKVGALKGIGALVLRPGLEVAAQIIGGGQERQRRAGTENVAGIISFGAVLRELNELLQLAPRMAALRDRLESELCRSVPQISIFGVAAERLPNTTCLAVPGVSSETQLIALDLAHIAVSAGAACSSGKISPSHVLHAMGIAPELARCALRISLGWETTPADVDRFIAAFVGVAARHAGDAALTPALS